jgi:peptide/nickel transport system substrate-binding protein
LTFTLDLLKKYPALDGQGLYSNNVIASYSKVDQNTLKVAFTKPTSTALWFFSQTPIVSQKEYSTFADPTKDTDSQPVGTGPFMLKTFSPAAYVLVKNPNYWQPGLPKVDTLVYHSVNDNTTAQTQITSGQIDWAGIGWSPTYDAQYINKDPQHYHEWFPGSNTVYLYLNLTNPMFQDVRVRQAISLGINRASIISKAAPYGVAANASGILLPANQQWLPDKYQSPSAVQLDAAKAESLLQQAGYTKGSDGIYQKNGQKLSFKMDVPNGWSDWQSALDVVSGSLKAIGIDAQQNALATPNIYLDNLSHGKYQTAISWTSKGPTPYFQFVDLLSSSKAQNGSTVATGTNYEHWTDPKTDQFLNQYLGTTDATAQKQAIAGIADVVATQVPSIPLYYNVEWDEYTTTHFTGWPDKTNPYDYGSPFNGEDSAYVLLNLTPVQ